MNQKKTMNFEQCPCSGRNLDKLLHAAILTLLVEEPLHGYELVNRLTRLKMFHGRKPDPTGVYRLLKQMEKDGLVRATLELSAAGPAKRSNQITSEGRRCLLRWRETLQVLQQSIGELLEKNPELRRR